MDGRTFLILHNTQRHFNVHIVILQDKTAKMMGDEWAANPDVRLDPESIAKVIDFFQINTGSIADFLQAYMYLVNQDRSAWTAELDRTYQACTTFFLY